MTKKRHKPIYVVAVKTPDIGGYSFAQQVFVWKEKGLITTQLADFPRSFVFDHLLAKHKAVVSDRQQTIFGKTFWAALVEKALTKNYHVYFLDNTHHPMVTTPIHSMEELRSLDNKIWGDSDFFQERFVAISAKPLD